MPNGRGPTFTDNEVSHLLDAIEAYLPIGSNEWDSVEYNHNASFPDNSIYIMKIDTKSLNNRHNLCRLLCTLVHQGFESIFQHSENGRKKQE